jgi:hypothetical protein
MKLLILLVGLIAFYTVAVPQFRAANERMNNLAAVLETAKRAAK